MKNLIGKLWKLKTWVAILLIGVLVLGSQPVMAATTQFFSTISATIANITTLNAPTGRTATFVVAPSDATATEKAQANLVLTGVADQTIINNYLILGNVYISSGNVYLSNSILVPANRTLTCSPNSTTINMTNAVTSLLSSNANSGQADVVLASASGLLANDYIIITSDDWEGCYKIDHIVSNTITLTGNLTQSYTTVKNAKVWKVFPSIYINGSNVSISNLKFNGNRTNRVNGQTSLGSGGLFYNATQAYDATYPSPYFECDGGIAIKGTAAITNITIDSIKMNNMPTMGVAFYAASYAISNVVVKNSTFTDIGDKAILEVGYNGSFGYDINHNYINGTGKAAGCAPLATNGYGDGIQFHRDCAKGISVSYNYIRDTGRAGIMTDLITTDFNDSVIIGNQIYDWGNITFTLTSENQRRYAIAAGYGNTIISDNYIDGEQYSSVVGLDNYGAIDVRGNAGASYIPSVTITNNKIMNIYPAASVYGIKGNDSQNSVITGNTFKNIGTASGNRILIYFDATATFNNVTISHNSGVLLGAVYITIQVDIDSPNTASDISIANNNFNVAAATSYPVRFGSNGALSDATIVDNNFPGSDVAVFYDITTKTNVRVQNNTYISSGEIRTISGTLAGVTLAGIMLSVDNPFGQAVRVVNVSIEVTTQGAASGSMCVGVGSSATTDYATIFSVLPSDVGTSYPYFYDAVRTATYGQMAALSGINWATGSGNRYLNFYAHVANAAYVATYTVTVMGN